MGAAAYTHLRRNQLRLKPTQRPKYWSAARRQKAEELRCAAIDACVPIQYLPNPA